MSVWTTNPRPGPLSAARASSGAGKRQLDEADSSREGCEAFSISAEIENAILENLIVQARYATVLVDEGAGLPHRSKKP
jgi:hypothetical protein